MLFDTAVTGLLLAGVICPATWREVKARVVPAWKGFAVAFGITMLIAGYPLWMQFHGPLPQSGSPFTLDFFKNDLSGLVVPSSLMLFHTSTSAAFATNYQGGPAEYLGYLGVPLIVVLVAGAVRFWRRPAVRACAVAWLVTEVLALGGTLLAAGHEYSHAKLPWYWVQGLPLLASVIPDRFSIVADGAAAALLAFVIDAAVPVARNRLPGLLATGRRPLLVVMSCAALAVLPLVPKPLSPADASPLPPGWTAVFTALHLPANANVLVVPIPSATFTAPLRWQAESGEPAAMVGGYYMGPAWNGHVYIDGDGTPAAGQYLNALWSDSALSIPAGLSAQLQPDESAPVKAVTGPQLYAQLVAWHLSAVVAVTVPGSPLGKYLTAILGRPTVGTGDVMAWHVLLVTDS
jgi:hypothetical protein